MNDLRARLHAQLHELESRSICIHCPHTGTQHYKATDQCNECPCTHFHPDKAAFDEAHTLIEKALLELHMYDVGMQN